MDKLTAGYLEAARRIAQDEEGYSCNAVDAAFRVGLWYPHEKALPEVVRYLNVFWPGRPSHSVEQRQNNFLEAIEEDSSIGDLGDPEPYKLRTLMLCLMAVCWRDFK